MTIITILPLLLGLGLLSTSLIVKSMAIRVISLIGGTVVAIWLTSIFSNIPGMYVSDHRRVENHYHHEIISELDNMLAEDQVEEAKHLIKDYLVKTEGSSFMRNPLHELVQSLRSKTTEDSGRDNTDPLE